MDELKRQLKETFATAFSLYLKAANFHWNVEGPNFYQYHQLFEDIYSDVYGSIDTFAEHCRAVGTYAPGSLKRFAELTKIDDVLEPMPASEMLSTLHADNAKLVEMLTATTIEAQKHNLQGLMNFLAGRIEQHNKWGWMLRASTKE